MGERKHLLLLGAGFSRNWGGWLAWAGASTQVNVTTSGVAKLRRRQRWPILYRIDRNKVRYLFATNLKPVVVG